MAGVLAAFDGLPVESVARDRARLAGVFAEVTASDRAAGMEADLRVPTPGDGGTDADVPSMGVQP